MDLGTIINIGSSLLKDKVGGDDSALGDALSSILQGSDGNLDLSNILSSLGDGDLGSVVSSWIGGGENAPIDGDSIENLLGSDKVAEFADKLGIDVATAKDALSDVLPQVVDKATPEGDSILDQLGGVDGIMNMAGKFFS